jgi:hypothetical protein
LKKLENFLERPSHPTSNKQAAYWLQFRGKLALKPAGLIKAPTKASLRAIFFPPSKPF